MAFHPVGRAGVIIPPSLPTIKESTLSWLGSDLESSLFSTNGNIGDNNAASLAKVQRYIDFDDQCLSLKSGEGSDFSGIQPLPLGSDDTPPMAANDVNRVVQMNFSELLSDSQNRPKPIIRNESDDLDEYDPSNSPEEENQEKKEPKQGITAADFQSLIGMLDSKMMEQDFGNHLGDGDSGMMEKLQLIRLWQLMQQEDLKRQQESEIAMLNAQKNFPTQEVEDSQDAGLENSDFEELDSSDLEEENLEELDNQEEEDVLYNDPHTAVENEEVDRSEVVFDDVPVEVKEQKSFEQLLEEELKREEEKQHVNSDKVEKKGPMKRPFLKKGQGLARFKGPPVRKPPIKPKPVENRNIPKQVKKEVASKSEARLENLKKPPTDNLMRAKLQRPSQAQKPIYKMKRAPIQKLQLKPERVEAKPRLDEDSLGSQNKDQDLEEFEMLERYAEDDASFFSEPSLIVSLLQHEKETQGTIREEGQMSLRERVRERRRLREEAKKRVNEAHRMSLRLNSENIGHVEDKTGNEELEETLENEKDQHEDENASPDPPQAYFRSPEVQKVKVIQRKTASLVKREKLFRPVPQSAQYDGSPIKHPLTQISNNMFSELQSSPNSAFSPHLQPIVVTGTGNVNTNNNTDDLDSDLEQNNDFQDEQTWGEIDLSVLNTSQSPNQKKNQTNSDRKYKCSDYMEPESEEIENPVRDTDAQKSSSRLSLSPPPPPTVLMQKLFPGLKIPKKTSPSLRQKDHSEESSEKGREDSSSENTIKAEESQAFILKQKLEELENEILKFRKENASLENLKKKQEEELQHLSKEMKEFKKQKDEELARIKEYKKAETKRLKKERKLFEEHVLATKMLPKKEEREEIHKLELEMESLKSDNKAKEQRWISANNRLRDQVERLETENKGLMDQIKETEEQRVKEWNSKKQNRTKVSSKWQAVNEIVESAVFDVENENPDRTESSNFISSNSSEILAKKMKEKEKLNKNYEGNNIPQKSSLKTTKRTKQSPLSESQSQNSYDFSPSQLSPAARSAQTLHEDGKVERTLRDGSKMVEFPNGTQKEISADGQTVKVKFANGDVKQIYADGSIVYFYKENGTTHTTHPDGLQVFEFPNKQVEHHFPDGTKQITFPDQTVKYLHVDGTEQTVFPDGTEMHVASNKDKTIIFANGQREIHTSSFKRREYPDGTSKTVFGDGRQETRYASGRLRVKDAHGNVIMDRMTNGTAT